MPIIDAHSHVWTPDTARYPLAAGFVKENMRPASFTPGSSGRSAGGKVKSFSPMARIVSWMMPV